VQWVAVDVTKLAMRDAHAHSGQLYATATAIHALMHTRQAATHAREAATKAQIVR